MELIFHWIAEHGFDLLGACGIVASLVFTGLAFYKDEQARHVGNLLAIVTAHREIWSELFVRPELARVLDPQADLKTNPVSLQENLFVNFLLNHLSASFRATQLKMFAPVGPWTQDIRRFLSLPIPKFVWEQSRPLQDPEFVAFIEGALSDAAEE